LTLTSLLAAWKKYRVLLMSCWHFLSAGYRMASCTCGIKTLYGCYFYNSWQKLAELKFTVDKKDVFECMSLFS
ncbi:TPA: hypothetical protein ACQ8QN_004533, partial [Escherichia coli]